MLSNKVDLATHLKVAHPEGRDVLEQVVRRDLLPRPAKALRLKRVRKEGLVARVEPPRDKVNSDERRVGALAHVADVRQQTRNRREKGPAANDKAQVVMFTDMWTVRPAEIQRW